MDMAIRLGRLQDSRLVATRLAPRRMYLCASPAYLERYGRPHSLSELARHNCLIGSSDLWALQQDGREFSQRVQGNWRCNSGQAVLDAALQGWACASCRIITCWSICTVARWCRCWRASAAQYGGVGAVSAAAASVAEGATVGGLSRKVGAVAGVRQE
jgi:DNA-binding transcriptional LysR family regulator